MHLLETYALSTGSKIKKPFIVKKYFPIPFEKYITIQNSSGMSGKCYDYFQDVVDFLYQKLSKHGYTIIQIGSKEDRPLKNTVSTQGHTNLNQTAFILENSKLHIGNDSFAIHMASAFGVPLVALYSVSSPEIAGPYWKNNQQICLSPKNWKPSFNPNEMPKRINEIKIEDVVKAVNKLLFKEEDSDFNFATSFIGKRYNDSIIECFPDQFFPEDFLQNQILNVRFDFVETPSQQDYNSTLNNLRFKKCSILTDKPLELKLFFQFKSQIPLIIYDVTQSLDINFAKQLFDFGFNFIFLFRLDNNQDVLNSRKLDLIDFPHNIETLESEKVSIEFKNQKLFYKSNKILFANGKAFLSKYDQENDRPLLNLVEPKIQPIENSKIFDNLIKNDLDNILIFEKTC